MTTSVLPGDVLLSKYRVERVLGQGGMGLVVAARHIDLGELFAIKFLLPEALENPGAVDRFLREARASARLKGEHVAKVHDVGRLETGAPYMVMEHLEGSDLKEVLRARGPLPPEEAAALMLQVCEAIAEAHAADIIHRDLKPANLFLIRRPSGTPCVKVLDFGISKQLALDDADLTKSGMIMGSPLYMAPEQIKQTKLADARSDIWSLGVVLYELVTAKKAFAAETLVSVIGRVLQEDPLPPSQMSERVPAALDRIVGRCLQKRPDDRFQSVEELAAALQEIAGLRMSSTSVLPPVDRTQPFDRASRPDTMTPRVPKPDARTVRISQTATAHLHLSQPGDAPTRASATGSAWGRTGLSSRVPHGAERFVAAIAVACVTVGIAGSWLARRPSPESARASQPMDTTPAATVSGSAHAVMTPRPGPSPPAASTARMTFEDPPVAAAPKERSAATSPSSTKTIAPSKTTSADPLQPARPRSDATTTSPADLPATAPRPETTALPPSSATKSIFQDGSLF